MRILIYRGAELAARFDYDGKAAKPQYHRGAGGDALRALLTKPRFVYNPYANELRYDKIIADTAEWYVSSIAPAAIAAGYVVITDGAPPVPPTGDVRE